MRERVDDFYGFSIINHSWKERHLLEQALFQTGQC